MISKKILLYLILVFFTASCSPRMHTIGVGVRFFNLSQNKYTKRNPYLKVEKENQIKREKKHRL
jgi:hypothetical protein